MEPASYNLAIVEDKPVVLDALLAYFSSSPNFKLILAVGSAEQFFENWKEQRIDLLLCDVDLPGKSGIDVTWYVKRKSTMTQVVMYAHQEDSDTVFEVACAGASGYLLKDSPLSEIERRLLEVVNENSIMTSKVAQTVLAHFSNSKGSSAGLEGEELTSREFEIVSLLQNGFSYSHVAERLSLTLKTLKFHIRHVYGKLQLKRHAELMGLYERRRMVEKAGNNPSPIDF